ncbi:hypothetical protein F4V88_18665 [Neorhizobium galegae]|nr:hypothetical protein F4V88_18665 [Neorhizobium galegae]
MAIPFSPVGIDHVVLLIDDMERALDFYSGVLGFVEYQGFGHFGFVIQAPFGEFGDDSDCLDGRPVGEDGFSLPWQGQRSRPQRRR